MKKFKFLVCAVVFLLLAVFIRKLPIFVSYSFWEEWGTDYSTGGYKFGLMNFQDALNFTPNTLIDVGNWALLTLYSFIPTAILFKIYSYLNKPAK